MVAARKDGVALDELRVRIDAIDDEILALLARRTEVVALIRAEKEQAGLVAHDPERERAVLARLVAKGAGGFPGDALARIFREVMSASVSLQAQLSIAFLGPEGTYSHMAARQLFGLSARYIEAATIEGVVDAVRSGRCEHAVAPIENSTEGSVASTLDALIDGGVQIRAEVVLPISHCLLSTARGVSGIERVCSHPQALAQCRGWLLRNLAHAQLVHTASTAAAVRAAALDPTVAAIASPLCAELYGVPVLVSGVQDSTENATRFVMLAATDGPPTGRDKTTIAFALSDEDRAGTLRRALTIFDEAGFNLTHIESRPSRASAWSYVFVVDLEGHRAEPKVAQLIATLQQRCGQLRVLGSYPRQDSTGMSG